MKGIYIMLLLMVASVSALHVQVECSEGRWNTDVCRDYELQDEFDRVTTSIDEVVDYMSDIDTHTTTIVEETNTYITNHEEIWSTDNVGGGLSWSDVGKRFFNDEWFFFKWDFIPYLKTIFATQDRLDYVEAKATYGQGFLEDDYLRWAGLIKADRTGIVQEVNGFMCHPGADRCIAQ